MPSSFGDSSRLLIAVLYLLTPFSTDLQAQPSDGGTIRGRVIDYRTRIPLAGANVVLQAHEPLVGAATDADGRFALRGVPYGRHSVRVSFLGYETETMANVLVTSGRETTVTVALREQVMTGEGAVVVAEQPREAPLNAMAIVGARSFSVEDSRRYAGGLDDPARMASAFAGVTTSGGVQENALVIRGNAPKGVQWRLEGVEIPNPNHFAGLTVAGGGGVTLFSSHLLDAADFMTGAFPAEYGNALSGVFDMYFRSGNPDRREHAVQLGLMGIEAASEGPFREGGGATYLFNYRYSTIGLLMALLPTDAPVTFQDLSFKSVFPTRIGRIDFWGIGGLDRQSMEENRDPESWEYDFWDRTRFDLAMGVGATGLTHHLVIGSNTYLRSALAASLNQTRQAQERLDDEVILQPHLNLRSRMGRLMAASTLSHRFGPRHTNRTGFTAQRLFHNLTLDAALEPGNPVSRIAEGDGGSNLVQLFSQSSLQLHPRLEMVVGLHGQYVAMTEATTLEPRASLRWEMAEGTGLGVGYGRHSQIEDLRIYLVEHDGERPNRRLKPTSAHHFVVGVDRSLTRNTRLKLDTYYQWLFDVPVVADSSFSMLNFEQDWTFNEILVNGGAGRNYGAEFTLERFQSDGWYYLVTGSVFKSAYRDGRAAWHPTRFDQRFAGNALFGREYVLGSRGSILGINVRGIFAGGRMRSPVDEEASMRERDVVYDEARPFTVREAVQVIADVTVTYRINRRRFSESWALQVKNALSARDTVLDYNYRIGGVEEVREGYPLPVLSWKIEF